MGRWPRGQGHTVTINIAAVLVLARPGITSVVDY